MNGVNSRIAGDLEVSLSKKQLLEISTNPTEVNLLRLFVILFLLTFTTLRKLENSLAYSIDSLL
jgi:hypothetical protein